jgi:hypothetical protein
MDPLDRHIADAVNVEPSPEFVARVRARIANEPAPANTPRWPLVIAAGVAATLAVAVYVERFDRERTVNRAGAVAVMSPAANVPEPVRLTRVEATQAPVALPRPRTMRTVPDSEVIVAADEVRGWRAVDDVVRRGRATLVFAEESVRELEIPRVTEIVVAPIQITPIDLASTATEGEGQ